MMDPIPLVGRLSEAVKRRGRLSARTGPSAHQHGHPEAREVLARATSEKL